MLLSTSFVLVTVVALTAASPTEKRTGCPGTTAWTSTQVNEYADGHTSIAFTTSCPVGKVTTAKFQIIDNASCQNQAPGFSITSNYATTLDVAHYTGINRQDVKGAAPISLPCGDGKTTSDWRYLGNLAFAGLVKQDVLSKTSYILSFE